MAPPGLQVIVRRISEQTGPAADSVDETVDVLQVLTSFQKFDQLAGAKRGVEEVTPIVQRLARQLLAPAP